MFVWLFHVNIFLKCICCIKVPISLKIDLSTLKLSSFYACRCFNVVSEQLQRRTAFQQQEIAFSTILFFKVTHRWKLIRQTTIKIPISQCLCRWNIGFTTGQQGYGCLAFSTSNMQTAFIIVHVRIYNGTGALETSSQQNFRITQK